MKLQSLQAARFLAASMVVLYHAAVLLNDCGRRGFATTLAQYGWSGVDLFFVISGFVIAASARGLTWRQFVAKRCQRILPLYMGFAVLVTAAAAVHGDLTWRRGLATLALWPVTDTITDPLVFGGWTLCFEALFYAATALVIWRRASIYPLLAGYVIALAYPRTPLLQYLGNPIIFEFLAGVLIAHAPRPRWSVWALPVGLLMLLMFLPLAFGGHHSPTGALTGHDVTRRVLAAGLPCALIIWGALNVRCRPGVLTYLGDASYSIYLCHGPVLVGLLLMLDRLGVLAWLLADAVLTAASVIAAMIACRVHELIEKPALAFLRRRSAGSPVAGHYDDRGYSGGAMGRLALRRR
jgi:exopolysaccharide production protein ExoZ